MKNPTGDPAGLRPHTQDPTPVIDSITKGRNEIEGSR
jgi:hypothetical protein